MLEKKYCTFCGKSVHKKLIEGRTRLFCTYCSSINYENPIPATAAIVLNDKNEILLVKRKIPPKKGQWCLPGGFAELEEDPKTAAQRELKEETNLDAQADRLIDVVRSKSELYNSVFVIGYSMKNISGLLTAGDDSEKAVYFPLNSRPKLAFVSHETILAKFLQLKMNE